MCIHVTSTLAGNPPCFAGPFRLAGTAASPSTTVECAFPHCGVVKVHPHSSYLYPSIFKSIFFTLSWLILLISNIPQCFLKIFYLTSSWPNASHRIAQKNGITSQLDGLQNVASCDSVLRKHLSLRFKRWYLSAENMVFGIFSICTRMSYSEIHTFIHSFMHTYTWIAFILSIALMFLVRVFRHWWECSQFDVPVFSRWKIQTLSQKTMF